MVWRPRETCQRFTSDGPLGAEPLQPFDRHATGYRAGWGAHPLARLWRARVLASAAEAFPAGGRVLDLGCGVGIDSRLLGALGFVVDAVDASAGMVARAREAGVRAQVLPAERVAELGTTYDAVLANFGVLNCVDLDATLSGLARCTHGQSVVIAVVMGPCCPAESLALLARGRPRAAWNRRRTREVPLEGGVVPVSWWRPPDLARAGFFVHQVEALGVLVAPPDLGGRVGRRARLEPWLARWPLFRNGGDHTLVVLRRSPPGAPR